MEYNIIGLVLIKGVVYMAGFFINNGGVVINGSNSLISIDNDNVIFNIPLDLYIDENDNVYVNHQNNNATLIYTLDGEIYAKKVI